LNDLALSSGLQSCTKDTDFDLTLSKSHFKYYANFCVRGEVFDIRLLVFQTVDFRVFYVDKTLKYVTLLFC